MNETTLICLVNFRRGEDTVACVESLLNLRGVSFHISICDNSPSHPSSSILREFLTSRNSDPTHSHAGDSFKVKIGAVFVLYSAHPNNPGFAAGNNIAARAARTLQDFEYYWLLNNDTEVDSDCLMEMLRKMRRSEKYGMCGSTILYHYDKKTIQVQGGSTYSKWWGTMSEIGNGSLWPLAADELYIEQNLDYVCGASMLVSTNVVSDIGFMREDYFLFFEEIDWCERARRAGYSLAYASKAIVYHKEGVAIGTGTGAKRSLLAEYYGMRNRLLVAWRLFPWTFPTVWLIGWLQVLRRTMQRRPANAWLMAKVLCGFGKRPV